MLRYVVFSLIIAAALMDGCRASVEGLQIAAAKLKALCCILNDDAN